MESTKRKLLKVVAVVAVLAMLSPATDAGRSKGGKHKENGGGHNENGGGHKEKGGRNSKPVYESICFDCRLRHIDEYGCLGCYTDCYYKAEGKLNCKTYAVSFCCKGKVCNESCQKVCYRCLDSSEFCDIPSWLPGCIKCDYSVDRKGYCAVLNGAN